MKYTLSYLNKFKKSLKKCVKRGLDVEKLKIAIEILTENGTLPVEYKPHKLSGIFEGNYL